MNFLRKLFDTSDRDVKAIQPLVELINSHEPAFRDLSDDELRAKTPEFKARLEKGETLENLLPEAFAACREASRRTIGMRQFDVQMIGSVVLHQGRIAEMKTGEGKTLVAVAPIYLNALTGRGVHLVTVNDYLARRDAVWMGPIYHFLGMSVGIIQGQSADSDELGGSYRYVPGAEHPDPRYTNLVACSRREAYGCDITYGTNHEFGFDYLRDNMAFDMQQLVMRELNYAIIDEVDSILIDEARTPHIISGPSADDVTQYKVVDRVVKTLVPEQHYTSDKKNHSASLTEEGMDYIEEQMGIGNIAEDPKLLHHVNAGLKAYALFDRDVDYVVRGNEVVIVDENTGRLMFGRRYSDGLHQALEAKENVPIQRESQTVATITFQNLFRLYNKLAGMTGTAKTEEDEFRKIYGLDVVTIPTNRPMVRVDNEDVIFKSEEAKLRGIAFEILRLYTKQQPVLVGTRSIEMSERVSSRLTPDMLQRLVMVHRLYDLLENTKTIRNKDEARKFAHSPLAEVNMPALKMFLGQEGLASDAFDKEYETWALEKWGFTLDKAEYFHEALGHGIPHNILNAKFHEKEAAIIAEAGRKGGVTIATNMAGRGVDILLGGRIADENVKKALEGGDEVGDEYAMTFKSFRRGGKERAAPPLPLDDQERFSLAEEVRALGGVYILGTERHESRRIDNQLRGRSGRQGDPGESRFFVSLEDQLWKIFNANMLENPLLKQWPPMEEVKAKFLSKMILKTQERIENHFFEARKHVLEYDDVLNAQREHIYGWRREVLLGKDCREDLVKQIDDLIAELVRGAIGVDADGHWATDYEALFNDLNEVFPAMDYTSAEDLAQYAGTELDEHCKQIAHRAFQAKLEELGEEVAKIVEQTVMLRAINDKWMDHLQLVDYIREGIGLRGYGQIDPLVAYKKETFGLFQQTLRGIREQSVRMIFRAQLQQQPAPAPETGPEAPHMMRLDDDPSAVSALAAGAVAAAGASTATLTDVDWKKVGRNDPCPCGSGKKFKACHYPELRKQNVI
ncbi:MAG: preprotein translocase subunit SecA [Fimbriimonadaceae bacterium]|nr:preprotein translocase subunit SecA [Fimbriimonadaceae bacterium]